MSLHPDRAPATSFTVEQYLTALNQAPFQDLAPYLTPICPDCDREPEPDGTHRLLHGWVVVGCGGYFVVDPNQIGLSLPGWLGLDALPSETGQYRVVAPLRLDLDELIAVLCDNYCARGGDAPTPLPTLTLDTLKAAVVQSAQFCARGWHEHANEPDNEDTVMPWAREQILALLPHMAPDPAAGEPAHS